MFVLILLAIALTPVGKADGINLPVQPLEIVNATVAISQLRMHSCREVGVWSYLARLCEQRTRERICLLDRKSFS